MVSNRRGPTSDCGCCAPPCTCLVAKESFRGIYATLSITGSSFSLADRCLGSNHLTGPFSGSSSINYDDGFCGDSFGTSLCPAVQSHYFGPVTITVGGVNYTTYVAGRVGNCPSSVGPCPTIDSSPDAPTFCYSVGPYGPTTNYYKASATAGVGISYYCAGGNSGIPACTLYVSASYYIFARHPAGTAPSAPTGWTRSGSGTSWLYTRNDNKATMSFNLVPGWHFNYFCNSIFITSSESVWQLNAFTYDANVTSVALDYPFDPGGIFAGVTGTLS